MDTSAEHNDSGTVQERPVVFDCEGSELIGVIHIPRAPRAVGLVTVAAGGIQFRAGCGRQLVILARKLAEQGIPVMRFDHRGHGDSAGELLGFQHMERDLARAVEVFRENVPQLAQVTLYGGCEAASAIMISAAQLPGVESAILANPWVDQDRRREQAARAHYRRRLLDTRFWKKLFSGQYNLLQYARHFRAYLGGKLGGVLRGNPESGDADTGASPDAPAHFEDRMLDGFSRFDGRALFLRSGQNFVGEEFEQLAASSKAWRAACARDTVRHETIAEADQTYSTAVSRERLCTAVLAWMREMDDAPPGVHP